MSDVKPVGEQLERLARRIVAGDVTFFIGAGYSLDSERNFAGILLARLLARLEAIIQCVGYKARSAPDAWNDAERRTLLDVVNEVTTGLEKTLKVKRTGARGAFGAAMAENITRLKPNYFVTNDWMCSVFQSLLAHWKLLEPLAPRIHRKERSLLRRYQRAHPWENQVEPGPIDFARFGELYVSEQQAGGFGVGTCAAGKALFLDAMGFGDSRIMCGEPFCPDLDAVTASYTDRLRPRHFVLAWLAVEGLLPVLVTTNYDLLLEGAYRLAGMDASTTPRADTDAPRLDWNRRMRYFTSISDAPRFFRYGDGHQAALILKIHGCVHLYRQETATPGRWRRALPRMVFTFREIQNWREDSWSRDYLRSLMRTRTIAFAGYSASDPVIHDTFRSVYEEMASYRHAPTEPVVDSEEPAGARATAFLFDLAPQQEFHAVEVLRAAGLAAGDPTPSPASHPNLVSFEPTGGNGFPTLDDAMLWTFHLTYRELQRQVLQSELRRVAYQLFAMPVDRHAAAVISNFDRVLALERAETDPQAICRAISWTVNFHRQLMREYAAADLLVREPKQASRVQAAMRWPWYAALSEHPEWGAWAVVLELALRRRAAQWSGVQTDWRAGGACLMPAQAERAAVLVPRTVRQPRNTEPKAAITIEVPEVRELSRRSAADVPLSITSGIAWRLFKHSVPWWQPQDERYTLSDGQVETPSAERIWSWARDVSNVAPPAECSVTLREFFYADYRAERRSA